MRISVVFQSTLQRSATISVVGEGAQGSFYVDDIQLEEGEAPSNYNLLENGDLQTTSFAYGWALGTGAVYYDSSAEGGSYPYTRYIEITGSPTNEAANATQTVNLGHTLDHTYVLSGWAKADAVEDNVQAHDEAAQDTKKQFGLRAILTYSDNHKEYFYVPFSPDISEWQYTSMAIVPSYKPTNANVTISTIDVVCAYEGNANVALFDDLSLVCAAAQSYTYDTDTGMPIFSESTGLNGQTVTYDEYDNIESVTVTGEDGTNIKYSYTYDGTFHHRLKTASNTLITQSLSHDTVGNVTTTTLSSTTDSSAKKIVTSSAYTEDGNLISSVTDAAGNTTSYGYGDISVTGIASSCDTTSAFYKAFGIPSTITDAKGNEAWYVTDTFGRVRQIEAFGFNEDENTLEKYASLKYTYGKTMLYEIQRTTGTDVQKYHFLYDNFGNTTSIGIGGWNSTEQITLASYEYAAMNGLLTEQTYGNGDKVEFTYDILGRAKTTTYYDENENVDRVLTYVYTGDGQLYSIRDSRTCFLYLYTYDSIGRLIGSSVKNADGEVLMSTRQEYNANNQLVEQHWTVGSTTYSETCTYDKTDGALTSYNNAMGETINLNYDALRRLSSVTGGPYERKYNYRDIGTDKTTSFVSSYHYKGENGLPVYSFSYTYDKPGNIASQTDASGTQVYTYDDQNQLTKVKNANGTVLYEYTYDNAGNILTANGHSYGYSTGLWKDQLTKFDNEAITYDGSGNPLSYYNGKRYTFTWEESRSLVSTIEGTNIYTYAYDSNGVRTSKTVNGVIHNYLYASGKLLRETYGNITLDFVYDQNGHPYALIYKNGAAAPQTYYYVTNLQGDVMYLLNAEKQQVASYSYDPYGKPLDSIVEGTIAAINPLRYRGYYYDVETGFYYLQSRYYDPTICRFINADSYASTGRGVLDTNMYAYCCNNPVNRRDPSGHYSEGILDWLIDFWERIKEVLRNMPTPEYINDQDQEGVGNLSYGKSTVSHSGCGPIAAYNAMVTLGEYEAFEDVLEYFNDNPDGQLLWGYAGTHPDAIASYFRDQGYRVYVSTDEFTLDVYSQTADVSIMFYIYDADYPWGFGWHYIEYSQTGDVFTAHNVWSNRGETTFSSPSDFLFTYDYYYPIGIHIYSEEE